MAVAAGGRIISGMAKQYLGLGTQGTASFEYEVGALQPIAPQPRSQASRTLGGSRCLCHACTSALAYKLELA